MPIVIFLLSLHWIHQSEIICPMARRTILSQSALDSGLLFFRFTGFVSGFGRLLLFLDGSNPPRLVFPVPFCWTQGWGHWSVLGTLGVTKPVVRLTSPSAKTLDWGVKRGGVLSPPRENSGMTEIILLCVRCVYVLCVSLCQVLSPRIQ